MSVPDNYQVISVTSTDPQIRVDIAWEYGDISELYIWQQDIDTGIVTYFNLGDFTVVEKSDGTGDYIEVQNVSTSSAIVNTARSSAKTQTYDLLNSEPLDPVALIEALDKSMRLLQEQSEKTGTPDSQAITSVNPFAIPDKVTRANGVFAFDENGDPYYDTSGSAIIEYSKEWAVNPEDVLVSTDAGGNGVDEYSSLHYSKKSEDFSIRSDEWANTAEDVIVDAGKYSAFHWSEKSSGFADDSSGFADKSNQWANNPEDVEVEVGEYSAFHWSKKAEEAVPVKATDQEVIDGEDNNKYITPQGAKSAYLSKTKLLSIPSVDSLRSIEDVEDGEFRVVEGYDVGETTGGGIFHWDLSATGTDDGGTTITPSYAGFNGIGRWIRKIDDSLSVRQFGAKIDGVTDDTLSVQNAISFASSKGLVIVDIPINYTVTVGSAGDFTNLNDALNQVRLMKPMDDRGTVNITLLADYIMQEQVLIKGENLSWVTIGGSTTTTIERSYLTTSIKLEEGAFAYPAFGAVQGSLPLISTSFTMDSSGEASQRHGVFVNLNSSAFIVEGNSFTNCGDVGAYAKSGSSITCRSVDFSGSKIGIFSFESSRVDADSAICNNCDWYGVYVNRTSSCNFHEGTATGCNGDNARIIRGSVFNADGATLTGALGNTVTNPSTVYGAGIYSISSTVHARGADVSNCIGSGVRAECGSTICCDNITADSCGGDASLFFFKSSTGSLNGASAINSQASVASVLAQRGSTIDSSFVNATGRSVGTTYGIRVSECSSASIDSSDFRIAGSDDPSDISVFAGGSISTRDSDGGLSQTANILTGGGILYL